MSEPEAPNHMTPEEFRRQGYAVVDWVADYMENIEQYPVLAQVQPGDIRAKLPPHPPEHPEPFADVMADLDSIVVPGITHWQSPNFYAFFSSNATGPAILGDLVSSGLGVQGMAWATSPAATELETHMCDWMVEVMGLPERFLSTGDGGGVIQDSASSGSLVSMLAARHRLGSADHIARMTLYTTAQSNSSIEKSARIAGIPHERVRFIAVDDNFAMRPDALTAAIDADLAAGLLPMAVVATTGTTSSGALDPLHAIADISEAHGLWLHVDGAYAGSATVCPEFRYLNDGLDRADSYVFNPHKWLLTNFDCSLLYVADRRALVDALGIVAPYLRNLATESGDVIDYRDWQVPLGRRFRALKLWFVLRHYGMAGLRAHIRRHVEWAQEFAGWVEAHPDFEVVAPVPLSLVCFRHTGGDEVNRRIHDTCNASGDMYLTSTVLDDQVVLRLAIGAVTTEAHHVEAAWKAIVAAVERVGGSS